MTFGFKCAVCGFQPKPLNDWFKYKLERLCSQECAIEFLLARLTDLENQLGEADE